MSKSLNLSRMKARKRRGNLAEQDLQATVKEIGDDGMSALLHSLGGVHYIYRTKRGRIVSGGDLLLAWGRSKR